MKPLQLPRRSVDSQSANRMLRKAAVVGTFEVANGECVVRLSNVMHPHAFASTCPTATDGVSVPAPKPETLIHDIQNGTIVVHESKRSITKKQLAVHINYLQTGANVARGTSGVCVCVCGTEGSKSPHPLPRLPRPHPASTSPLLHRHRLHLRDLRSRVSQRPPNRTQTLLLLRIMPGSRLRTPRTLPRMTTRSRLRTIRPVTWTTCARWSRGGRMGR